MVCLFREYKNNKAIGECGKKNLRDSEVSTRAIEITCPRCMKTQAFKAAAKHPFYGLKSHQPKRRKIVPENLEELEEEMFGK